jgi:hypothetical protein
MAAKLVDDEARRAWFNSYAQSIDTTTYGLLILGKIPMMCRCAGPYCEGYRLVSTRHILATSVTANATKQDIIDAVQWSIDELLDLHKQVGHTEHPQNEEHNDASRESKLALLGSLPCVKEDEEKGSTATEVECNMSFVMPGANQVTPPNSVVLTLPQIESLVNSAIKLCKAHMIMAKEGYCYMPKVANATTRLFDVLLQCGLVEQEQK